ncbi:MAG: hypothetical protein WAU05_10490, partial [Nitrospira sp.]
SSSSTCDILPHPALAKGAAPSTPHRSHCTQINQRYNILRGFQNPVHPTQALVVQSTTVLCVPFPPCCSKIEQLRHCE